MKYHIRSKLETLPEMGMLVGTDQHPAPMVGSQQNPAQQNSAQHPLETNSPMTANDKTAASKGAETKKKRSLTPVYPIINITEIDEALMLDEDEEWSLNTRPTELDYSIELADSLVVMTPSGEELVELSWLEAPTRVIPPATLQILQWKGTRPELRSGRPELRERYLVGALHPPVHGKKS